MFFTLITLTIINFNKIKLNILSNSIYFMKYVFPSLFIVMIITSMIKLYLKNQNRFMTFITLATSFSPVNACLTNNQDILLYTTLCKLQPERQLSCARRVTRGLSGFIEKSLVQQ